MRLALIPPVCMLHHTVKQELQMLIPVGLDYETYRRHYKYLGNSSSFHVILDNGMFEGNILDDQNLLELAAEYKVSEIVMPDVKDDPVETIERQDAFLCHFDRWYQRQPIRAPFIKLMAVVQGTDLGSRMDYIKFVGESDRTNITLGFPRRMTEDYEENDRLITMQWVVQEYHDQFPLHMLGLSRSNPIELRSVARELGPFVRGVDTSAPFVWAAEGGHLDCQDDIVERQAGYMLLEPAQLPGSLVRHNIGILERWCRGE